MILRSVNPKTIFLVFKYAKGKQIFEGLFLYQPPECVKSKIMYYTNQYLGSFNIIEGLYYFILLNLTNFRGFGRKLLFVLWEILSQEKLLLRLTDLQLELDILELIWPVGWANKWMVQGIVHDVQSCHPALLSLNAEVVIQCGTIFEPKGFDISRLCHSNLSRSEGHSFCGRKKRVHLRSISDPHLSSIQGWQREI